MMKKNSRGSTRSWSELPYDVLVNVFMSLNIIDLAAGVSGVCRSWRAACSDPMLWRETDFNTMNESDLINIPRGIGAWSDQVRRYCFSLPKLHISQSHIALEARFWFLGIAVVKKVFHEKSKGSFARVFAFRNRCRTPNLKQLVLSAWSQLAIAGFEEAVKHWKDLESLTVVWTTFPCTMLKSIGTHCKNFSKLAIVSLFNLEFAVAIVRYIPQLKVFSLLKSIFCKEALTFLMKNLKHLEVLDLSHNFQEERVWHGNIRFVIYVDPDNEINKNGSRSVPASFRLLMGKSCN
ncbi:F-box/LRR-repeat protein At3g48880 [Morus notabilis]|uniref:F-box/LRR-repeat protein At3g48880 n=1 Tax=Morus notabilis TaxID=981085 RepID=UPI000CED60A1|nr:F-box/LRR-repeat protein At3g48880 [Morus notabilis]